MEMETGKNATWRSASSQENGRRPRFGKARWRLAAVALLATAGSLAGPGVAHADEAPSRTVVVEEATTPVVDTVSGLPSQASSTAKGVVRALGVVWR
jgi:hypothetical protein